MEKRLGTVKTRFYIVKMFYIPNMMGNVNPSAVPKENVSAWPWCVKQSLSFMCRSVVEHHAYL